MKEYVKNENDDKKEITAQNEGEDLIHIVITKNERENNWDNLEKVIEELLYDTTPAEIKKFVNNEGYDDKGKTPENEG